MILVHPDDILIPENRFRREFDQKKLDELAQSIKRGGLYNPITVERDGDKFKLRAGERRLRAMKVLIEQKVQFSCGTKACEGLIPCIEYANLTALQRLEVEVEENTVRADFTWQERIQAVAALHALRTKQNPEHTVTATATEVLGKPAQGDQRTNVSNALIIAKHLDNPEVAKAKDQREALRIIRKNAEAVHQAKLAETFDMSKTPHTLIKGNALELLPTLGSESVDVIITDTPYGVGADNFGKQSSTGHEYEDSKTYFDSLFKVLPEELFRVAKQQAHLYLFCDQRRFTQLETLFVLAGWNVWPTMLQWYKGNGMLPMPDQGPRRTYESILYAYKGGRKTLQVKNDCITKIPGVKNLKVGAQKPVALYCDLLSRSARPGDTILDCFGGSGPILVAANRMRLKAIYIELSESAFNIAQARVNVREIDDGAEEDDGIEIDFGEEASGSESAGPSTNFEDLGLGAIKK